MYVCGIENRKFEKDGREIHFCRVSLLTDLVQPFGEGQSADVVNVSLDKLAGVSVGDTVDISYNKYGKIKSIDVIE